MSPRTKTLLCEIAPGVDLPGGGKSKPAVNLPRYAIAEFDVLPNGDLRARDLYWNEWVSVHKKVGGLSISLSPKTILRLAHNGYLRVRRLSPHVPEVSLRSLRAHIDRVEADPDFWSRRSVPAGWDTNGDIVWEDCLMSRYEMFKANDIFIK